MKLGNTNLQSQSSDEGGKQNVIAKRYHLPPNVKKKKKIGIKSHVTQELQKIGV